MTSLTLRLPNYINTPHYFHHIVTKSSIMEPNETLVLDDILHGDACSGLVAFLTIEDITTLQSLKRDFNSERSSFEATASSFISIQQFKPRALVKQFLKWIQGDFDGNLSDNRTLNHRVGWNFGEFLGEHRFDMNVSNAERDHELAGRFYLTFGCSPSLCFELYLSSIRNGCHVLPKEPRYTLWACLHITAWDQVASTKDRSATFVGAGSTDNFERMVSRVIVKVRELFDDKTSRPSPPSNYNAAYSPHPVNKSVLYLSNPFDDMGYEYEIVAALPSFTNLPPTAEVTSMRPIHPGYILDVGVRYNQHYRTQGKLQRHIDFFKHSLEKELLRDGEMVVMTTYPTAFEYLGDRVLSQGSIHHPHYRRIHPRSNDARVLAALDLEHTRISKIRSFFQHSWILFEPTCVDGEPQRLDKLKFVAHLINIGMSTHASAVPVPYAV
jgi:hypothetical protein